MKLFVVLVVLFAVGSCTVSSRYGKVSFVRKNKIGLHSTNGNVRVSLDDRVNCTAGQPDGDQPENRSNTTAQVDELLSKMAASGFDGYVTVTGDAHQSEYADDCEERTSYISGFTGSNAAAVILANGTRAVWTDGRYFIQAEDQLGCEWLFMKTGEEGVPTVAEWIAQELQELSSGSVVSADARMVSSDSWLELEAEVGASGITLTPDTITNGASILDEVWNNDGRPACSNNPIFSLGTEFTGLSWQEKISNIYDEMTAQGVEAYVLTKLDETAWTLNVRGSDIPYNPVFPSYIIIDLTVPVENSVTFYVKDYANKAADVYDHLGINNCTGIACVTFAEYDTIEAALIGLNSNVNVNSVLMPYGVSYYVYSLIPDKRLSVTSPVLLMKAMKNPTESASMRYASLKDSVALMSFLYYMDTEMAAGTYLTEMSAMANLDARRPLQKDSLGLSFNTISAYGSNGAIIHYSSSAATDRQILNDSLYMVDSGGQYKDGTTDVTRTLFYGTDPDPDMKEAYTRVLMGQIDFGTIVFPKSGTRKYVIDIMARNPLYRVGWDYRHGTSHGIGMCLNVHEDSDEDFELGFFGSDEPGYYEEGRFGVRLENMVTVVETTTDHDFYGPISYTFDTVTLVPYVPILIDTTLLSTAQCNYLNSYNQMIQTKTSDELTAQGMDDVRLWMLEKTAQIVC